MMVNQLGSPLEPLCSWPDQGPSPGALVDAHYQQKWWMDRMHRHRHLQLMTGATARDAARLQLQSMPPTTAWLNVTPNAGLGFKMESVDFTSLLKWWLGKPVTATSGACPCCEQQADVFGDHLVSCKFNQPTQRHNALRDALHEVLLEHGIAAQKEVVIGEGRRPADVALPSFDSKGPTAVDLVVHHPLCPSRALTGNVKSSLKQAEEEKTAHSESWCQAHGWLFSAVGWHTWGGTGPRGSAFLARLEKQLVGDRKDWGKQKVLKDFRSRLGFTVMRYVARQLRAAGDVQVREPLPQRVTVNSPPLFCEEDMRGWDEDDGVADDSAKKSRPA